MDRLQESWMTTSQRRPLAAEGDPTGGAAAQVSHEGVTIQRLPDIFACPEGAYPVVQGSVPGLPTPCAPGFQTTLLPVSFQSYEVPQGMKLVICDAYIDFTNTFTAALVLAYLAVNEIGTSFPVDVNRGCSCGCKPRLAIIGRARVDIMARRTYSDGMEYGWYKSAIVGWLVPDLSPANERMVK